MRKKDPACEVRIADQGNDPIANRAEIALAVDERRRPSGWSRGAGEPGSWSRSATRAVFALGNGGRSHHPLRSGFQGLAAEEDSGTIPGLGPSVTGSSPGEETGAAWGTPSRLRVLPPTSAAALDLLVTSVFRTEPDEPQTAPRSSRRSRRTSSVPAKAKPPSRRIRSSPPPRSSGPKKNNERRVQSVPSSSRSEHETDHPISVLDPLAHGVTVALLVLIQAVLVQI